MRLDDVYAFSSWLVHAMPFYDTIPEKILGVNAEAGDTLEDTARHLDDMIEGGSYGNPNKIGSLLDGRPELMGSTRDK